MQPDDMERNFREKMKAQAPAWDKAKNWDAIEARLPGERKRRPIWFFWLLAVAVVGSATWWGIQSFGGNELKNPSKIATEPTGNQSVAKQNKEDVTSQKTTSSTTLSNGDQTKSAATQVENESVLNEKSTEKRGQTTSQNTSPTTAFFEKKTASKTGQLSPVSPVTDASIFAEKQGEVINILGENLASQTAEKTEALMTVRHNEILEKLSVEVKPLPIPPSESELKTTVNSPIDIVKNTPHFGFEIYGGMGISIRRFSAIAPENQAFINERQQREQLLESIETGIQLNAQFRGNWGVSTGLEFQKINEKFSWNSLTTELVNVYRDSAFYTYNANNVQAFLSDSVQATLTKSRRVSNFNSHTSFNVPLLATYEKRYQRFSLRANAGAVVNFYRGFQGVIFDENENIKTGKDLRQSGIYRNKTGLSLQAGLQMSHAFEKFGELFVGIHYRHSLTSLSGSAAGYEQRYSNLGARLGWRF